jgi:hypothetical protein
MPATKCYKCRLPRPASPTLLDDQYAQVGGAAPRVAISVDRAKISELAARDPIESQPGTGIVEAFDVGGTQDDEPLEGARWSASPPDRPVLRPMRDPVRRSIAAVGGLDWQRMLSEAPGDAPSQPAPATTQAPLPPRPPMPPGPALPPRPLMPPGPAQSHPPTTQGPTPPRPPMPPGPALPPRPLMPPGQAMPPGLPPMPPPGGPGPGARPPGAFAPPPTGAPMTAPPPPPPPGSTMSSPRPPLPGQTPATAPPGAPPSSPMKDEHGG